MMKRMLSVILTLVLCVSLLPVTARAADSDFTIENGVLTKYNGAGGDVTIPNSVTSIGGCVFFNCRSLTSVTIPSSVISIKNDAFYGCRSLTSVTIPNSVTSIGERAFYGCSSLTNVTISNNVTSIAEQTFCDCSSLINVTIPSSVTRIRKGAFNGCRNLERVNIPSSLIEIGEAAFSGCSSLMSMTIPSSVIYIGRWAFNGCNSLTAITVDDGNRSYQDIDGVLFNSKGNFLLKYPSGKMSTSYEIPNSVTRIDSEAFHGCIRLTCVKIPNSVTSIGENAFYGCNGLTSATIPDGVTIIDRWTFYGCTSLTSVTIPNSVDYIASYAFGECKNLTIPNSVTSIGYWAFGSVNRIKDVYYGGSEDQWNKVTIGAYNNNLTDAAIHYNSKLIDGNVVLVSSTNATVPAGKYCFHVIDESGKPLKDATVTWDDGVDLNIEITDAGGNAYFAIQTIGTPLVSVDLTGYTKWNNANSNWRKSPDRYETVVLYPESYGGYKLREAYYANNSLMTDGSDILTHTKKLNLKNDGNLVGDLTNGEFYIACSATKTEGVVRYELWQNQAKIAESTTGSFGKLSVKSFSKGGGCFVRVVTANKQVDTHINLEFASNDVNKESSISFAGGSISFKVADDIPFLGGGTVDFKLPQKYPVTVLVTDQKIQFGFNVNILGGKSKEEQMKSARDLLRKSVRSGNMDLGHLSPQDQLIYDSLTNDKNSMDFFKSGQVNFLGYAEADIGSSTAKGQLMFQFKVDAANFEYNTWVMVVPVTVQIKMELGALFGGEVSYDWANATLLGGLDFTPSAKLTAFGGVGISTFVGVGAYGSAELKANIRIIGAPAGFRTVDLTGELGLKAYAGWLTYQRAFAHQTWHLYSANTVGSAALLCAAPAWNEGLYDASAYAVDDLSYLAAESGWLGNVRGGLRLLASSASAKTEFKSLLTDTYRNAQPVMVSSGDALYAAFVRADAETGTRYVVVTKSEDGTSWAEPVRVDADAILDDAPSLCVDGDGALWLAYARTTEEPGDSLLAYAQNQEIVVGSVDPDTLAFTECKTFAGEGFTHMQQVSVLDGQPVLMWADTALTDENSVLLPASGTIRYAVYDGGLWSDAAELASVTGALTSVTAGTQNGQIAAAYVSGGTLYTTASAEPLAEEVSGRVRYGVLPGTDEAAFLWNGNGMLYSSNDDEIVAEGITHEYAVVGDKIYYSMATDNSANLAVLQYEDGNWSLPIQLTGDSRYLENLSAARLNGDDVVMGMHTAVTITDDSVEDAKNLVVSRVMPVSDLRIDGVDYDDDNLTAGEPVPVTLTVVNAGDHTVNSVELSLDGTPVKTEAVELLPGQSVEIEAEITCPSALTAYTFAVVETDESDYTPADSECELSLGYADAAVELDYQQIGTSKALVATVTNQGVEAASGSVIFYDADGKPVAESTFEDLAAGDIAVASYAVTESFSGVNGGDVSAKIVLDQEELYTYNNETTMHILKAYTPTSIKSVKKTQGGISVEVVFDEDVRATVVCAAYNSAGQMLRVESETVDALEGETRSFDFAVGDADAVKVFVLGDDHAPLCEAKEYTVES